MRINANRFNWTVKVKTIEFFLLFLYLCIPLINFFFSEVLSFVDLADYSRCFTLTIIMGIYLLLCIFKRKLLVVEFWIGYILIALFFMVTYLVNPEYEYYYSRSDYGAWAYIFRPDNGLMSYLLLRLVDDPKKILKAIKLSGWFMYFYYGLLIASALTRGYWVDTSNYGYEIHMSYNLSLGYNVLLFPLAFLYSALEDKKISDWIGASIGLGMILIAGSRGPFLDVAIFMVIYVILKISNSRKKTVLILGLVISFALLWLLYPFILVWLSDLLEQVGLSSRFLTKLSSGDIMDDAGRNRIWSAAIEMIRSNPFGHGAMGSRPVMFEYVYAAHPHQVFLEILIDFGVFVGSVIIVWLLTSTVKVFRIQGQDEWRGVFLVFFARACQLLVSVTFWHSIGLWGALAVGSCALRESKRGKLHGGK